MRDMAFRGNFLINAVTRLFWFAAQLTYYELIFMNVEFIQGWTRPQYYAFMATGMLINSIVEMFFMPNCAHFSELIRTGNLDFALLKPIDTQFLISCEKVEFSMLNQMLFAVGLLSYGLVGIGAPVSIGQAVAYVMFVIVGVMFFYSLMILVASTSVWLGRNQGLYDFWFYITVFARYPRNIYNGVDPSRVEAGEVLQATFTYLLPILLVVTVPAEFLAKGMGSWEYPAIGLMASTIGLVVSRVAFQRALLSYRSASS